jgi:hypothetical protein
MAGPPSHPASHVVAADAHYPDIPALIISGELDSITTMADGAAVAAAFNTGIQIRIANSFHVNASAAWTQQLCRADRAPLHRHARAGRYFLRAAKVPPLRLVPRFAVHAAGVDPAVALPRQSSRPRTAALDHRRGG